MDWLEIESANAIVVIAFSFFRPLTHRRNSIGDVHEDEIRERSKLCVHATRVDVANESGYRDLLRFA